MSLSNTSLSKTLDIGIVIVPDARSLVARMALETAHLIETHSTGIVSRIDTSRLTHITLFQGHFPATALPAIYEAIPKISICFDMAAGGLDFRADGKVFWRVVPEPNLPALHRLLHQKLHPLAEGMLMQQCHDRIAHRATTDAEREHIRMYGSLLAGPNFLPHITLAQLQHMGDAPVLMLQFSLARVFTLFAHSISVATLREDGSVEEILHTVDSCG
ncbi:MAG: hypothetical protein RL141_1146 [Candidatus Parcubacteria bacterium]|jgi:2'-5' RNA ligase